MAKKIYKSAPLPFSAQKKNFLKEFEKAITTFDQATIFVDLFGGSGLLSHITKRLRPDACVIYNDFDNYRDRLENVDRTNALIAEIYTVVHDAGVVKEARIPNDIKSEVVNIVKHAENAGYVDWVTLSCSLLFTMHYANSTNDLSNEALYNNIRSTGYMGADGYLDGLDIVSSDYKTLFEMYKNVQGVVFIVDPPYMSTDAGMYKSDYWRLREYIDLLKVINGTSYIYFTSSKSAIIEMCTGMSEVFKAINPFDGAEITERVVSGKNINYTDIMLYKKAV